MASHPNFGLLLLIHLRQQNLNHDRNEQFIKKSSFTTALDLADNCGARLELLRSGGGSIVDDKSCSNATLRWDTTTCSRSVLKKCWDLKIFRVANGAFSDILTTKLFLRFIPQAYVRLYVKLFLYLTFSLKALTSSPHMKLNLSDGKMNAPKDVKLNIHPLNEVYDPASSPTCYLRCKWW